MADEAIAGFGRIIARHRHEWLRAFLGGCGGVASMCGGVVRACGAKRARFGADAPAYANSTGGDTGNAGC
jgi:hypothetical protein